MITNLDLAAPSIIGHYTLATLAAFRAPAFLPEFLFENQIMFWIAGAIVALLAFYIGTNRRQAAVRHVGEVLGLVIILWIIAASLFVSSRERLREAHYAIINAAKANNPAAIEAFFTNDFHFGTNDRAAMSAVIETALSTVQIKSTIVRLYDAKFPSPREAMTQLNIITNVGFASKPGLGDLPAGNYLTKWQLDWVDVPDQDWRLQAIAHCYLSSGTEDQELPPDLSIPK